MLYRIYF